MKRIKFNLAIIAVLMGSGAALATTSHKKFTAPNYYNSGTISNPTWVPLTRVLGTIDDPGTYRCDAAQNVCTAFFSSPPTSHQAVPADNTSGKYMVN